VGADVTLEQLGSKTRASAKTGGDGSYSFPAVQPADYRLTVRARGFADSTIEVQIGSDTTRDFTLTLAGDARTVNVVGSSDLVDMRPGDTPTRTTLSHRAITLFGTPAQTNLLKTLDLLPSLHVDTADPYGMVSRLPYNMRARGQAAIGMSTMVEGVPVWGIETPGPRVDMFDLENIESIDVTMGGEPADKGLGVMNTAGGLDIHLRKPADKFHVTGAQDVGSFGFRRTYARLDSGKLATGTAFHLAGSYSEADKWKGKGGAPGFREHIAGGIEQTISPRVSAAVFVDFNHMRMYAFQGLASLTNLAANYYNDYNTTLTGNSQTDTNYYQFNQQKDRDVQLTGRVTVFLNSSTDLVIRPYYWTEYQVAWSAQSIPILSQQGVAAAKGVRARSNYFNRVGDVAELTRTIAGFRFRLGYWFESYFLPLGEKYYTVGSGGSLIFNSWTLDQQNGRGTVQSPYVTVSKNLLRNLHLDAGVRYLRFRDPGQNAYLSAGLGDLSYQLAIDSSAGLDPGASYQGRTKVQWLPSVGLNYGLTSHISTYASYGRNYARPHGYPELMQTYISARTAYTKAGVNMQHLFDQLGFSTSDNYDVGTRIQYAHFYVAPSLFDGEYNNKLLTVWDPVVNRTVRQAVGRTRVYGAELQAGASPVRGLELFGSYSYNHAELRSNLQTAANAFVPTAGKQTPDTPQTVLKGGFSYTLFGATITPVAKYVGPRFGDAANLYRVPSYFTTDLTVGYEFKERSAALKETTLSLSFLNLFNRKYAAAIAGFEDQQALSFLVGPPRAIVVKIGRRF
jgi:iron complex outermembrane receptor protein